jgi:RNA polymerase-binding transcription factor DksA
MSGNPKSSYRKRRLVKAESLRTGRQDEIEARLCDERSKVRALLASASPSLLTEEYDNYWQNRVLSDRNSISNLGYRYRAALLRRLRRIDEALEQLKAGSYGRCLDCDVRIKLKSLVADPATTRCPDCHAAQNGGRLPPDLKRFLKVA